MLVEDIGLLRCVDCAFDLKIIKNSDDSKIIINGLLECTNCLRQYPVLDSVVICFRKNVFADYISKEEIEKINKYEFQSCLKEKVILDEGHYKQLATKNNWEYQWLHVKPFDIKDLEKDDLFGKKYFWKFIPIDSVQVKNKVVFVGCAGRGRETYHLSKEQPKKIIVIEIGTEIYTIQNIIDNPNNTLLMIRCDLSYHPIKDGTCDVSICDHALQHVLDHKLAFQKLVSVTKPKGLVSICVYSWENNQIMNYIIEPAKKIIHLLPVKYIRAVSLIPAVMVYLLIHFLYMPLYKLSTNFAKKLPLFEHMKFWSTNSFNTVWTSCFDLIHAPISYHFREMELIDLAKNNNLKINKLLNVHSTTWSIVAENQATA